MSHPEPRPGVLDVQPYVGGKSSLEGHKNPIKLASNESALGPSPRAVEAYRKAADGINLYPDGASEALREAIGARHGLDPARVVCGNGSDELISLLARAYAGPGDEVIFTEHGFAMYPIATRAAGATPSVAPEVDLRASIDAMLERVTKKTKLVFIATPNNPTGSYVPAEELRRLRAGLPEPVVLVIDAAYAEYVTRNDYSPGVELVDGGDNTVMLRTFSKIYALAGLRLGWAYAPANIADVLNRVRNPFNVTVPAQAAGIAALEDVAYLDSVREHNAEWLPWFAERLAKLGLEPHPSVGNFVLVRFPKGKHDADAANAFLNARGIIPRQVANYGLPECLRITVGREDELRAVIAALTEFMG